ncbi:MAG: S-layer homology domain-containing protein [Oscillospiraceae bacterium]|nr:S-layer homology domain-containing protein [Oscillospiraceae bacterium]
MRRFVCLLLTAALLGGCLTLFADAESGFANFHTVAAYTEDLFDDVSTSNWFHDNVAAVYELGLMVGSKGSFQPKGEITLAETITMAARLHSIYSTGAAEFQKSKPWYQVYVDYATAAGILSGKLEASRDMNAPVTRRQFAAILAHAFPESALPEINAVEDDAIPDVKCSDEYGTEIYRLYRAGILKGSEENGSYLPDSAIQRSGVAAIVTRMVYRSLRLRFTLERQPYPDLIEKPRADDSLFANSAMVGNSLAQGMKIYSGLRMNYFVFQSTTVFSPNGYDPDRCYDKLLQGQYDRVYMEYGINEIGYGPAKICEAYGKLIDEIRARMPGVEIYVMAVTPVTYACSTTGNGNGTIFTMTSIRNLNAALREMCREKQCWYLDCCELLCDSTGYLPQRYAGWDASPHLAVEGYQAWAEIIRTHY